MENIGQKRILVSAHPKKLADEVKAQNPKDIVHFFYDSEDQSFESSDLTLKDYDYIFLTDEDYTLLLSKLNELTHSHLCVIYTDLESEFFLIPPGSRVDSYCFGLFDDWLSHIDAVLHPPMAKKFNHGFSISRKNWDKKNDVLALIPKLIGNERISKNLEENIKFIFRELISNAFIHTQTEICIVEFEKKSQEIALRVTDFEGNFPKSRFISNLFPQKRMVEPNSATKGAGIGMFLVAQIANEFSIRTCSIGTSVEVVIPQRRIAGQASFYKKVLLFEDSSNNAIGLLKNEYYSASTS